uniref:Uncharacterized protein n=1 Tax=Ditylenchus dipsaci TaxID=166011 RepID=A0A915DSL4_9BILA
MRRSSMKFAMRTWWNFKEDILLNISLHAVKAISDIVNAKRVICGEVVYQVENRNRDYEIRLYDLLSDLKRMPSTIILGPVWKA